jgi:hypothetical protein
MPLRPGDQHITDLIVWNSFYLHTRLANLLLRIWYIPGKGFIGCRITPVLCSKSNTAYKEWYTPLEGMMPPASRTIPLIIN